MTATRFDRSIMNGNFPTGDDAENEKIVRDGLKDKIRRTLGKVPFTGQALAAYYAAIDPETPAHVKAILIGALAYFVVPTDLIPDFIVGFGYTDDAAVLATALRSLAPYITAWHRKRAAAYLEKEPPPDET